MGILSWIIFGLIAGALARWVMPGSGPHGIIITIIIGVVGAFIGGYIGTHLGMGSANTFDFRSLFLAVVGGVVLLAIHRLVTNRSS
ncbi:MAG: GlsB/YeaQ/YmgE family stress response membrane protein [Planctomycetes bacterium]|nr:GlsB/YeaQ/YmgE family stress response membrane protein [Planctomycetota bacterium]